MSPFGDKEAPTDGAEAVAAVRPAKSKRAHHQPSRDLRLWVVDYALLQFAGMAQQDDRGPLGGMAAGCFQPWLSTRTLRQWLDDNEKEGREPRDACDVLIPILQKMCDPCWRGRRPDLRVCGAADLQQSGRATRHDTQDSAISGFRHFLRSAGFKYRVASDGIKKTTDPELLDTHVDKLRFALDVLRDGVQRAPTLHHEHGRDVREALGLGAAWVGETEAGRTGALHRRR